MAKSNSNRPQKVRKYPKNRILKRKKPLFHKKKHHTKMDFGSTNHKPPLYVPKSQRNQRKKQETLEKHGCQTQKALKNTVASLEQGRHEARGPCRRPVTLVESSSGRWQDHTPSRERDSGREQIWRMRSTHCPSDG